MHVISRLRGIALSIVALNLLPGLPARGDLINFEDAPPGSLYIFAPHNVGDYTLNTSGQGFDVNSPTAGNGASQTPGNNPYYAGENGLHADGIGWSVGRQDSGPFTLNSIELARNNKNDPTPTITFFGNLAAGGTVQQTIVVNQSANPLTFQTYNLTGFTNVKGVSWSHENNPIQVGNFNLTVPEPASVCVILVSGASLLLRRRRSQNNPA
jgi:hypothetical protein